MQDNLSGITSDTITNAGAAAEKACKS